jgi:hypothetical protein
LTREDVAEPTSVARTVVPLNEHCLAALPDPTDGTRTGLLKGFSPSAYNRAARVFAQLTGKQRRTWR